MIPAYFSFFDCVINERKYFFFQVCKNAIFVITYMKGKIIKGFCKSCSFIFLRVTYMKTKFFLSRVVFYNQIRLLSEKNFSSKRAWEIPKNKNEIYVSVATLAMLAVFSK